MLESAFKKRVRIELEKAGWYVIFLITTNKNGIPDIMALRNGTTIFIETKQKGKQAKALQQYRLNQLQQHGFAAFVCDSIEQIKHLL